MTIPTTISPNTGATGQVAHLESPQASHRCISDIILALGLISMGHCEAKMEAFYAQVKQNNDDMKTINELTDKISRGELLTKTDKENIEKLTKRGDFKFEEVWKWQEGRKFQGYNYKDPEAMKAALKTASDGLGSVNTIDMTKLQSAINKMNEMTQLVSNNLSKFNSMNMAIIGNLR